MEISKIQEMLKDEPRYRADQAKRAVFVDCADDWNGVAGLPKILREKLQKECPLDIKAEISTSSEKNTVKALLTLTDGSLIETVLMRHEGGRNTVCVSSQVGCPMGCVFCATGTMGLTRNLTADEIVSQVLFFQRYLKKEGRHVHGIVFMGMGEPFLNYDNVLSAIRTMHDPNGFNIGARHFSISTSGVLQGIKKMSEEDLDINLAISLHASNDEVRKSLMPIARGYTIQELLDTVDAYIAKKGRKVMFEHLMIQGVNDSEDQARELAALMKKKLYVVNLISYNDTGVFTATSNAGMARFKDILEKAGVEVTVRYRFGQDINGACGQLVTKKMRSHS